TSPSYCPPRHHTLLCPPPQSPLFPYTTLFRSELTSSPASTTAKAPTPGAPTRSAAPPCWPRSTSSQPAMFSVPAVKRGQHGGARSEEHTSELQSRENLVCRLLLEKKKKKTISR